MTIADDLKVISDAVTIKDSVDFDSDGAAQKAYNRLFADQPLRDLIAQGHKIAWVHTATGWILFQGLGAEDAKGATGDLAARPVIHPSDMATT
jgi:hypothetical protein